MNKIKQIYLAVFIVLAVSLFLFLLGKYYALSGELTVSYDYCDEPSLISLFEPSGRASDVEQNTTTKECYQRINAEPVYFSVKAPRSFDNAEVSLTYRNFEQSIIELGIQKSADWNFELKPFENKIIDSSQWSRLEQEDLILLQKQKDYENVDDFVKNIPLNKKIATYFYEPNYNFKLDNYDVSAKILTIDVPIRGKHELYTYIENEDLDFTFTYQDLNWQFPEENFVVRIFKDDVELHSEFVPSTDNEVKEKNIKLTNLNGGVYKIILEISDDIVITKIQTAQNKLVFKDKLFIVDNEAYINDINGLIEEPRNFITNSDELTVITNHETGLQTLQVDDDKLDIDKMGNPFQWRKDDSQEVGLIKEITSPRNDLLILGYGYFAFNEDSFFDPDYGIDELRTPLNIEQYDYIIAQNYQAPSSLRSWNTATQNFSLEGVPGDRKNLFFVLSAPDLIEVDDIAVRNITVKLTRSALTPREILNKIKARF